MVGVHVSQANVERRNSTHEKKDISRIYLRLNYRRSGSKMVATNSAYNLGAS